MGTAPPHFGAENIAQCKNWQDIQSCDVYTYPFISIALGIQRCCKTFLFLTALACV